MAVVTGTNAGFVSTAPTADPAGTNLAIAGYVSGGSDTSPSTATTVTEIGFWMDAAPAGAETVYVGIYNDNGSNYPSSLVGSASFTSTGSAGWQVKTGLSITISSSTKYWIVANSPTWTANYGANTGESLVRNAGEIGLDDPFDAGQTINTDLNLAVYAVWSAGGGTPAPAGNILQTQSSVIS